MRVDIYCGLMTQQLETVPVQKICKIFFGEAKPRASSSKKTLHDGGVFFCGLMTQQLETVLVRNSINFFWRSLPILINGASRRCAPLCFGYVRLCTLPLTNARAP